MFCAYFFARFSSFCHKFCMNVFCPQKGASFGRAGGDGQKERRRLRARGHAKERRHVPPKGGKKMLAVHATGRSKGGDCGRRARKRKTARSAKRDRAARKEGAAFRVLFDFLKEIILLFPLFSLSSFWAFPQRRVLLRRQGLPL